MTADESEAASPAEPPRLTSRPRGAMARQAASATQPNTGSTTTSAGPSSASVIAAASSATSPDSGSVTTAWAPLRRARSTPPARHTATTRPAPCAVATPTAA